MGVKPGKSGVTETKRKSISRKEGLVNCEMLLQSSSKNGKGTIGLVIQRSPATLRAISTKVER